MKILSIVIPVYNEGSTIAVTLARIKAVQLQNNITKQFIIVNDCSTDDSVAAIKSYTTQHPEQNIQLFSHAINKGKGAALHTGIAAATGDYIIIQDADLEYNPEEYKILLQPLEDGVADVVYGSRFMVVNRIAYFSFGTQ
jgi:glycosyltransferase involved in cell wall biosynthesis